MEIAKWNSLIKEAKRSTAEGRLQVAIDSVGENTIEIFLKKTVRQKDLKRVKITFLTSQENLTYHEAETLYMLFARKHYPRDYINKQFIKHSFHLISNIENVVVV